MRKQIRFKKCRANNGMSSLRSRSGRHHKRNDVEAIKKVFAKVSLRDFFFQIFIGRSNHSHIDCNRIVASYWNKALLFQRAQNFGLRLETHVADFIEKQSSPISLLKLPSLSAVAPGKDDLRWPNNSLSIRSSGIAAQFISTNISSLRGLCV